MFVESGIIVFMGLVLLAWKLPVRTSLWLLDHCLAVDIAASVLAYWLHQGSFAGMMAAAVAGLMTSAFTSLARATFGYIHKKEYHPGWIKLEIKS